jgi:hypothetical protein
VLRYTGANVVDDACVRIPVPRTAIGADGLIDHAQLRTQIAAALTTLLAG